MQEQDILVRQDGRRIGFQEYGIKTGFPIIGLHGTPGSRIWFNETDPISEQLGVRLITMDRPGYGLSTKKPKRTIYDFNDDIDFLVKKLKIDEFSIFGVSGGGAYALSYASSRNSSLFKTGIIASVFEFKNRKIPKDMCSPNRIGFYLAQYFPWLLRFSYNQQKSLIEKSPDIYMSSIKKNINHLCKSDQALMQDDKVVQSLITHLKEAYKETAHEAVNELRLFSRKWEIDIKKIRSKVEVWHGEKDTLSPINGLKEFIIDIPNYQTHFLKEKGHFLDEDENIWKGILESLMK